VARTVACRLELFPILRRFSVLADATSRLLRRSPFFSLLLLHSTAPHFINSTTLAHRRPLTSRILAELPKVKSLFPFCLTPSPPLLLKPFDCLNSLSLVEVITIEYSKEGPITLDSLGLDLVQREASPAYP
jgi:hypothetical protein